MHGLSPQKLRQRDANGRVRGEVRPEQGETKGTILSAAEKQWDAAGTE